MKMIMIATGLLGLLAVGLYLENTSITVTELDLYLPDLPANFEGYRIVHLSDYHSGSFGPDPDKVLTKVRSLQADLIVHTGDFFDQRRQSLIPRGFELLDGLKGLPPFYYIVGNHEWSTRQWPRLQEEVQKRGANVLRNRAAVLTREGEQIWLIGLDDPVSFYHTGTSPAEELNRLVQGIPDDQFVLLLSHRPELIALYEKNRIDLVLSGHAHGGQVRLPWIGGLIAPEQGLFPRYSEGVFLEGSTTMVVSRGLGNSIIPQRLFNRPEIISISLHRK